MFLSKKKWILSEILNTQVFIPYNIDSKTVVFDLDETLIHCNENSSMKADVLIPI